MIQRLRALPLWLIVLLWLLVPAKKMAAQDDFNQYRLLLDEVWSLLLETCIHPQTCQPRNWACAQIYYAASAWVFRQKDLLWQLDKSNVLITGWLPLEK